MATPNPRDISELQRAVNDASSRTTALWVSFMTFAAYLIVAAGSVSHLALFQETAIKLPILAAELPLVAFFAIAPFFLLLFHFYLFLFIIFCSEYGANTTVNKGSFCKSAQCRNRFERLYNCRRHAIVTMFFK